MATTSESYARFSVFQRVEHWILTLSFTLLAVTGLPQRYALSNVSESIIAAFGGLEATRIVHHVAAIVMIVIFLVHLVEVAYKFFVLRLRPTLLPTPRDVLDALQALGYNLGLLRKPPQLPRYNFAEKAEYWAVMWGTVIMALTGFMLWNPIVTTKYLPGQVIPAAKVAHSSEAVLAVLAIIVWHFYWAHLKTLNLSMFNGKLSSHQMTDEHSRELAEIRSGVKPLPVSAAALRRRSTIFVPVVAVVAVVAMVGLYLFTSYEQTAIATVPPAETAPVFVPATPTATNTPLPTPTGAASPTAVAAALLTGTVPAVATTAPSTSTAISAVTQTLPAQIPHELQGRENCLQCHAIGGALPEPASHANYPVGACLICHTTAGPGPLPKPVAHTLQDRENCLACHTGSLLPQSHAPADFKSADCLTCHGSAAPAAAASPTVAASPAATLPTTATVAATLTSIPAATLPTTATVAATLTSTPATAPTETAPAATPAVTATAAPSATTTASAVTQTLPAQIPHELQGRENCLQCHAIGGALPEPASHANYTADTCLTCHTTAGPGSLPKPVMHTLQGRENCLACHAPATPAVAASPAATAPTTPTAAAASGEVGFARDLQPLLQEDCGLCHHNVTSGDLKVTDYDSLMKGGASGPVVEPGAPDRSLIVAKMKGAHPIVLKGADLQTLIDWIAQGAKNN